MLLKINALNKTYKNGVKALNNINLDITDGMFGLLGPNGAGKSTMMRTIATLQEPDAGSIHFNDINVLEDNFGLRKVLGYLPQEFGVYPKVSAYKLLDYFASLKGVSGKKDRKKIKHRSTEQTAYSNCNVGVKPVVSFNGSCCKWRKYKLNCSKQCDSNVFPKHKLGFLTISQISCIT